MKKQIKLTESELLNVIKESIRNIVLEYGEKNEKVRSAMAKAAKRAVDKGDDSVYHNAVNSITKAGGSKEALADLNNKFEKESKGPVEEFTNSELERIYGRPTDYDEDFDDELNSQPANNLATEGRMQMRVTESQLKEIIREAVDILLEKFGNTQLGQYQLGRLAARKKQQGDEEGYKNVVNNAKLQWGADRGVGTNQNAFGNGFHIGKDNVKHGYDLAKKGKL